MYETFYNKSMEIVINSCNFHRNNKFLKGHKVQIPERKILLIHQKSVVTCRERKAVPIHRCLTSEGTVIHQTTDRKMNEKCDFFSTYSQMHKKFGLNSSSKMNK